MLMTSFRRHCVQPFDASKIRKSILKRWQFKHDTSCVKTHHWGFYPLNEGHKEYLIPFWKKEKKKGVWLAIVANQLRREEYSSSLPCPFSLPYRNASPAVMIVVIFLRRTVSHLSQPVQVFPLPLSFSPYIYIYISLPWLPFVIRATSGCWWALEGAEKGEGSSLAADVPPTAAVDRTCGGTRRSNGETLSPATPPPSLSAN